MKKFWKFGLLSIAAAAFFACGDDSSSGASDSGDSSSSAQEFVVDKDLDSTSPVKYVDLAATTESNGEGGESLTIKGTLETDTRFNDERIEYDVQRVAAVIDSVRIEVGKIEDNGKITVAPLTIEMNSESFGKAIVPLKKGISKINLDDVEGCGDYRLYLYVHSTAKFVPTEDFADQETSFTYKTLDSTMSFTKTCKSEEPESSSSVAEEKCKELKANEVTLSNNVASDMYELNLATGEEGDADISLKVSDETAYLVAADGVEFIAADGPQIADESMCEKDVSSVSGGGSSSKIEAEQLSWYIVKTAKGKFPLYIDMSKFKDDDHGSLTIIYYK